MYKKELSDKKFVKQSNNLFSLLDDENDINNDLEEPVVKLKNNIIVEENYKKPHTNNYKPNFYNDTERRIRTRIIHSFWTK